ncbi:MAG: site-specific DNA-methyltransferase [Bacteroides sp.]|nr:site-specific DNA-methyltransferase [Bacteroides sp.]
MSRIIDFNNIIDSLGNSIFYTNDRATVALGDSLQLLKKIPDNSVSLILTDPPYHSTKKGNIINDKAFSTDDDFISWMELYAMQWKRVLRPNGSIFMFCSSCMESKLTNMLCKHFNVLSHIVWTKPNEPGYDGWKGKMKKEALRQWYPHSERIIFMEAASEGNLNRSYFGNYLKRLRTECNLSGKDLTGMIGAYGRVNHGGAVSNWESGRNIPSKEQYASICEALKKSGIKEKLLEYEDVIRPFEVNANVEFTDVWTFPSVKAYKGKHPAEKPVAMLEHCIQATTFPGDIVLDCFAGSGSTIVAALLTHRIGIGIEIDNSWCFSIKRIIENAEDISDVCDIQSIMKRLVSDKEPSLFDYETKAF